MATKQGFNSNNEIKSVLISIHSFAHIQYASPFASLLRDASANTTCSTNKLTFIDHSESTHKNANYPEVCYSFKYNSAIPPRFALTSFQFGITLVSKRQNFSLWLCSAI
jgi:hypothetical protein